MRARPRSWTISVVVACAVTLGCAEAPEERPDPPVVVEDAGPVTVEPAPDPLRPTSEAEAVPPPEIVLAPDERSRGVEEPRESLPVEPEPVPERTGPDAAEDADSGAPRSSEAPAEAEGPEGAEGAPDSGPRFVPAGVSVDAELRTPFHSATTRVGDRFAARTLEPIVIDGRTAVETNTLVEGRVVRVASAEGPGGRGLVELDLTSIVLPSGERIPLEADVAAVEPRRVPTGRGRSKAEGAAVGAGAGGAAGAILGGSRKATAIGAILGGVAGAVLVSGEPDHELLVPSGTVLTITLEAPLEVPPRGR